MAPHRLDFFPMVEFATKLCKKLASHFDFAAESRKKRKKKETASHFFVYTKGESRRR